MNSPPVSKADTSTASHVEMMKEAIAATCRGYNVKVHDDIIQREALGLRPMLPRLFSARGLFSVDITLSGYQPIRRTKRKIGH